jgi:hypothetical protein
MGSDVSIACVIDYFKSDALLKSQNLINHTINLFVGKTLWLKNQIFLKIY